MTEGDTGRWGWVVVVAEEEDVPSPYLRGLGSCILVEMKGKVN